MVFQTCTYEARQNKAHLKNGFSKGGFMVLTSTLHRETTFLQKVVQVKLEIEFSIQHPI